MVEIKRERVRAFPSPGGEGWGEGLKAMKLLVASNNQGKVREYAQLLEGLDLELVTLAEVGIATSVAETGATFEENAILKATAYAQASGLLTLADDSGLEVDALGGEPGVRAARYAGESATDPQRIAFLLSKLEGVPPEKRTARFRCVIAIASPEGRVELAEGSCEGVIALESKGELGFGYDPVFFFPELGQTLAELPLAEKNRISHRGRAAAKARAILKTLLSWRG